MSGTYSGSLSMKKKAELQEIAQALAINDAGTREDLQQRIKKHLEDNSSDLENDPAFSGLYTTRSGRRQRSLQPSGPPTHSHSAEPPKFTAIAEEGGTTPPPADELHDTSMTLPDALQTPNQSPRSSPRKSSPRSVPLLSPSPAKSRRVQAKDQPEVQIVAETGNSLAGRVSYAVSSARTFLSSSYNIFIISALLDFVGILYNIHVNSVFPMPPVYVAAEPALSTTAMATMYWAIPSLIIPSITGYLITFSPASRSRIDVLSAAIIRVAANFVNHYPLMVFLDKKESVKSLDVLGFKWRTVSASVSLAFAFAEAIAKRNGEA